MIPSLKIFDVAPVTSYTLWGETSFTSYRRLDVKPWRRDAATLQFQHQPGVFNQLHVDADYVRSKDPIDFVQGAVVSRGDVATVGGRGDLDLDRIGGSARLRRWDYAAGDQPDGHAISWTGRVFPIHSEATRGALAMSHTELVIASRTVLESDLESVVLRRAHSEGMWTELEAGRVEIDFHDGSPHRIHPAGAFTVHALGGTISQPVHLEVRVANDVATTFNAELSRTGGGTTTSVAWNTSLDAEGGLYRVATLSRGGALASRDSSASGRVLEAGGSYARIRPLHGAGPEVNVWRANAGISIPFGPYFSGRVGWDFVRQQAPVSGSTAEFDRNRYSVSVALSPRP